MCHTVRAARVLDCVCGLHVGLRACCAARADFVALTPAPATITFNTQQIATQQTQTTQQTRQTQKTQKTQHETTNSPSAATSTTSSRGATPSRSGTARARPASTCARSCSPTTREGGEGGGFGLDRIGRRKGWADQNGASAGERGGERTRQRSPSWSPPTLHPASTLRPLHSTQPRVRRRAHVPRRPRRRRPRRARGVGARALLGGAARRLRAAADVRGGGRAVRGAREGAARGWLRPLGCCRTACPLPARSQCHNAPHDKQTHPQRTRRAHQHPHLSRRAAR